MAFVNAETLLEPVMEPLYSIVAYPNIWSLDKITESSKEMKMLGDFPRNIVRVFRVIHIPRVADTSYRGWRATFELSNGNYVFLEACVRDFEEIAAMWVDRNKPNCYYDKTQMVLDSEGPTIYGLRYDVPEIRLKVAETHHELLSGLGGLNSFQTPRHSYSGCFYHHMDLFLSSAKKGGFAVSAGTVVRLLDSLQKEREEEAAQAAATRAAARAEKAAQAAAAQAASVTESASILDFIRETGDAVKTARKSKKQLAAERRAAAGLVAL